MNELVRRNVVSTRVLGKKAARYSLIIADVIDNESYTWCSIIASINRSIIPEDDVHPQLLSCHHSGSDQQPLNLTNEPSQSLLASFPFTRLGMRN